MFFSYNGKIYYSSPEGAVYPVRKTCEKLIISSKPSTAVEGMDRLFELAELKLKTNTQDLVFEKEAEAIVEKKKKESKDAKGKEKEVVEEAEEAEEPKEAEEAEKEEQAEVE